MISISEVGIEVTCELGFVEREILGAPVNFELRLDATEGTWLPARGLVTHVRPETHRLIITTLDPIPELDAYIARWVVALHGATEVMVVDRDQPRRERTAAAFRRERCTVFEATTPLEALDHLGHGEPDPTLIEVAPTTPEGVGDELSEYLEVAHPDSHVVRVSSEGSEPVTRRTRERSALRTRIRAVLDRFRK